MFNCRSILGPADETNSGVGGVTVTIEVHDGTIPVFVTVKRFELGSQLSCTENREELLSIGTCCCLFLLGTPPFLPTPFGIPSSAIDARFGLHLVDTYHFTNDSKLPLY